jgi:hypothetical protein
MTLLGQGDQIGSRRGRPLQLLRAYGVVLNCSFPPFVSKFFKNKPKWNFGKYGLRLSSEWDDEGLFFNLVGELGAEGFAFI